MSRSAGTEKTQAEKTQAEKTQAGKTQKKAAGGEETKEQRLRFHVPDSKPAAGKAENGGSGTGDDIAAFRDGLADEASGLMGTVLDQYRAFRAEQPDQEAKAFAAHHAAARAALAHLDLLIKLARWAAANGDEGAAKPAAEGDGDPNGFSALLAEARTALDNEDWDGDG